MVEVIFGEVDGWVSGVGWGRVMEGGCAITEYLVAAVCNWIEGSVIQAFVGSWEDGERVWCLYWHMDQVVRRKVEIGYWNVLS